MAKRLKRNEHQATEHLWQAHDLLKGNGVARAAIQSVVEILQSSDAADLTNVQYDNLPVSAKPMTDPKRRGLVMRHGAANGRYWLFRTECPESGKQVEIPLGQYKTDKERDELTGTGQKFDHVSIADARGLWAVLDARRKDKLPFTKDGQKLNLGTMVATVTDRDTEYTVEWLATKYLTDYASAINVDGLPVKRSVYDDELLINKHLLPDHGKTPLAEFTAPVIDDLLDGLTHIPRVQEKMFSLLSVMNKVGRKQPPKRAKLRIAKRWIPDDIPNPMPNVTPVVSRTAKRYASSDDEIQRYVNNLYRLKPNSADALLLQVQTVARVSEVAGLAWAEVDLDAGVWMLPAERSKNGHAHPVYLSEQSLELLRRRRADNPDGEWVFPSPFQPGNPINRNTLIQTITRSRDELEVDERFTSHATRHRALSWMKSNGIGKEIRDAASNHHTSDVDSIYTETAHIVEPVRLAVQRWCDFLEGHDESNVIQIGAAG